MQDLLKRQTQDKEDAKKVEWLGRLPNIASGMEARAATISTVLVLMIFARRTKRGVGLPSRRQSKETAGKQPTITSLTNEMLEMVPSAMKWSD